MIQIKYLLSRALSGYIFMLPVLILYFLLLFVFSKKQKVLHILVSFVFGFYLFLVVAATGIGNIAAFSFPPQIMLMPFRDVVLAPKHFILNIVAFVPLGAFLPLLCKKCCNIRVVAVIGFLFSLCIEILQMLGWGATEIDDLMANTLGVCLGYFLYELIKKIFRKDFGEPFRAVNINGVFEILLISACTFLIMALILPLFRNDIFVFY